MHTICVFLYVHYQEGILTKVIPDVHFSTQCPNFNYTLAQEIIRFSLETLLHPRLNVIILIPHTHFNSVWRIVALTSEKQEMNKKTKHKLMDNTMCDPIFMQKKNRVVCANEEQARKQCVILFWRVKTSDFEKRLAFAIQLHAHTLTIKRKLQRKCFYMFCWLTSGTSPPRQDWGCHKWSLFSSWSCPPEQ